MKSNKQAAEISHELPFQKEATTLRNVYLFKGNSLYPLSAEYPYAVPPVEKQFRSTKELEQLMLHNSKTLFGQQTILIPMPKKSQNLFENKLLPNNFLLDMEGTPRFYFLDTVTPEQDFFKDIFPRFTRFFLFLIEQENIEELAKFICKEAKKELGARLQGANIFEYVKQVIATSSCVLALSENGLPELNDLKELYQHQWRVVHSLVLKKYSSNGDTFCTLSPSYLDLHRKEKVVKEKVIKEKVPVTEEQHFEGVSDEVKAAYLKIKEELLKIESQLQFNPQTYYVALKKDRNLAFFHFRKNKIDLVVKYPEKETLKLIKKHEVRALKESIQKFWGGTACSIILENSVHLQEVIGLLKLLLERR